LGELTPLGLQVEMISATQTPKPHGMDLKQTDFETEVVDPHAQKHG